MRLASTCALIAIAAGGVARGDVRDAFGLPAKQANQPLDCGSGSDAGCAIATDPMADATPYATTTWLPADYLLSLPTAYATHDQVAGYVTGVGRDDAGLSIAGGNGLDNRWTIDGAPSGDIYTGGTGTRVPLTFLDGILVQTGGFAARDRTSLGGTIDAQLKSGSDHFALDVYAWGAWSADAGHLPALANTYDVRTARIDPGPAATVSIVASGPIPHLVPGAKTWFVAGVAPSVNDTRLQITSQALVDANGDGTPDGLPGIATTIPIEHSHSNVPEFSVPALLRAGVDGAVHHFDLTAIGNVSSATVENFEATQQAGVIDQLSYTGDVIATYRAETHDWKLRVQTAWHRQLQRESAHDAAAADLPQAATGYIPSTLPDDPTLAAKCTDTTIDPCPISGWFANGGAGELQNITADRFTATADAARRFGNHALRIGGTVEDSRAEIVSSFTGGEETFSVIPGEIDVRRFISQTQPCSDDITQPCPYVDLSTLVYRTLYGAAYAEDTWQMSPRLRVDYGLRWELMWVGTALHFSDELAPRLGLSWDFLGGGRSRAWVGIGRSFATLPAGVAPAVMIGPRYADELTYGGSTIRTVYTGAPQSVADGIAPVAQDEVIAGVEIALARFLRARAYLQGRWLRTGIESTADGFANPGQFGDMDPAARSTRLFALELSTPLGTRSALRVGWAWGATYGNWTGAFDPVQGAVLFHGIDFDNGSVNQMGPLPTTPGQRFYFEAEHHVAFGRWTFGGSARLSLQSGMPIDVMGEGPSGLFYLLPRGAAGYGPMQTLANLRLAASYRRLDITLDLLNVGDQRTATNQAVVYADDAIQPIVGGSYQDLVFLRTLGGALPARLTSFETPNEYRTPFMAVLGVHRAF